MQAPLIGIKFYENEHVFLRNCSSQTLKRAALSGVWLYPWTLKMLSVAFDLIENKFIEADSVCSQLGTVQMYSRSNPIQWHWNIKHHFLLQSLNECRNACLYELLIMMKDRQEFQYILSETIVGLRFHRVLLGIMQLQPEDVTIARSDSFT